MAPINSNKHLSNEGWIHLLEGYSDIASLKDELIQFFALDKSSMSIHEIEKRFFETAKVYPFNSTVSPPNVFNSFPIYRARKNINPKSQGLSEPSTYSYPPQEFSTSNGRANLKGKSVFYCAHNGATALLETKPNAGDILYLTKWESNCDRNVSHMSFLPLTIPSTNPWVILAQRLFEMQVQNSSHLGGIWADHLKEVTTFIADSFVVETEPYCFTSWLADKALFGNNDIDFIVYPSIPRQQVSCNFTFHPDFVDRYMCLEYVLKIETLYCDGNILQINLLEAGDCRNDIIEWREPNDNDWKRLPGKDYW